MPGDLLLPILGRMAPFAAEDQALGPLNIGSFVALGIVVQEPYRVAHLPVHLDDSLHHALLRESAFVQGSAA